MSQALEFAAQTFPKNRGEAWGLRGMVNDVCRLEPADRPQLGMVAQRTGLWDRRSRTPAHGFPRLPYGDRPSAPSPALPPRTAPLDPGHKARQRQAPRAHGPPIAAFQ